MKKRRSNIFETNSSSTHTFTISDDQNYTVRPFVEPNWDTEFGWSFETWDTAEDKLAYILRCLASRYFLIDPFKRSSTENSWADDDFRKNENIFILLKPFKDRCNGLGFDFPVPTVADFDRGYIDHDDWYVQEIKEIIETDEGLLNFIFNPYCEIHGGNDNC